MPICGRAGRTELGRPWTAFSALPCHRCVRPAMAKAKSAGQSRSDLRARLYDWECVHVLGRTDQDVGFWLEVARAAPGPCLELACGTGRVSVPLAAAGI